MSYCSSVILPGDPLYTNHGSEKLRLQTSCAASIDQYQSVTLVTTNSSRRNCRILSSDFCDHNLRQRFSQIPPKWRLRQSAANEITQLELTGEPLLS
uniref:Uncharacterized protein n=1 Tax=Arundo donax TaxID=35708 RepID=A0A0A9EGX8_ARUDO